MSIRIAQLESPTPDLAAARRIIADAEAIDGTPPVSDQALLAAAQGQRAVLLAEASSPGTDPLAVAIVGQGEIDLVVRPDARGAGVGSSMLAAALGHAEAAGTPTRMWVHGIQPAAESLLRAAGFSPVRTLLRMELDPERLPATDTALPSSPSPGLSLRAYNPERAEDAAAWVRANAAAFADHPEQGRITEADFALITEEPWFAADDLLLLEITDARSGAPTGELAGSTWIKTLHVDGTVECELYAVGIRPEHAGRGLGRLLLDATLARMAQHRPTRVSLYVDGENERAVELYERASFTIASSSRQWLRAPSDPDDVRIDV